MDIICPDNKILNPKTKRCVLKTGAIGKQLLNQNDLKKSIIRHLLMIKKTKNNVYVAIAYQRIITRLYHCKDPILSYDDFVLYINAGEKINKVVKKLFEDGLIRLPENKNKNDFKEKIINHLVYIRQYELANNNRYKASAYQRVIVQLTNYKNPIVSYEDFIKNIKAGDRINKKVEELIKKGKINYEEENIKKDENYKLREELNKIFGIGEMKIKKLIKDGIKSIDDLKQNQHLLNDKQKIGLKYYDDLNLRIPLDEYLKHKKIIEKDLHKLKLTYDFVGSYRRCSKSMGDIDILIMENDKFNLTEFIRKLEKLGYIKEILALGKKKAMCIVKIDNNPARQVDILVAPFEEYYFSLMYFTGSADFNIGFRNYVKTVFGASLSEHGIKESKIKLPTINSEKDIFNFFHVKYVEPAKRKMFISPA